MERRWSRLRRSSSMEVDCFAGLLLLPSRLSLPLSGAVPAVSCLRASALEAVAGKSLSAPASCCLVILVTRVVPVVCITISIGNKPLKTMETHWLLAHSLRRESILDRLSALQEHIKVLRPSDRRTCQMIASIVDGGLVTLQTRHPMHDRMLLHWLCALPTVRRRCGLRRRCMSLP